MTRILLASRLFAALMLLAGAAPAMAQTATPPAMQPSPDMLDGANRGIRPIAPMPGASGAVRQAVIGPASQSDHDYMARLAGQLHDAIVLSQTQLQATQNPAVQRTARHIIATRQRELNAIDKWLAHHST